MVFTSSLKSTLRHLLKNKLYLGVNILSLAVGLICCIFAFLYIQDELSYDDFHEEASQIFRIEYQATAQDGSTSRFANLHGSVLPTELTSIPEIELNTRFAPHADLNIEISGKQFAEQEIFAADSNFFNLFTFNFISGNPGSALANPNAVVLSKSTAVKYFNSTDVLNETLSTELQGKEVTLTIAGVIEDIPSNSHFHFDLITSPDVYEKLYGFSMYEVQMAYSYIRLIDNSDIEVVQDKINELTPDSDPGFTLTYLLQPLTDIHLYSSARGELSANGDAKNLYFLALITLIILGIACINFTTLATARSFKRTTEIGIRKVFGALKSNLITSFLVEGVLLSIFGLLVAYLIIGELLPFINSFTGKSFAFTELLSPAFMFGMILMTLIVGCIAGLYPALVLSSHRTSSLLLKQSSTGSKKGDFWKSVIVIQFTATLILVSATYIIHQQINFIQNKELGFNKEQIVTIPNYFNENPTPFLSQISQHPNIIHTTVSSYVPGISKSSGTASVNAAGVSEPLTFDWISIDPHFIDTYDIELEIGRNFSDTRSSDSTQAFIINETAANTLGWENPIGKSISAFGRDGSVIGVTKDFNFLSLHNKVAPLIMTVNNQLYFTISVKMRSIENVSETISYIEEVWQSMTPGAVFSYKFVDEQFEEVYKSEEQAQTLFLIFSGLAIFVAVLGLFSFASYSVQQKEKEIGIRKVLGATTHDILQQFYTGYFKFLLLSSILAFPIVYFWMKNWLQNFSYQTSFGFDVFSIPLLIAVFAILISVSYQVIKSAYSNPADSLRSE